MNNSIKLFTGTIEVRLGWNAFHRNYSGGFFSGVLNGKTQVESNAKAVFCMQNGKPVYSNINDSTLCISNRNLFDSAAVYHESKNCMLINLDRIPENATQICFSLERTNKVKGIEIGKVHEIYISISNSIVYQESVSADKSRINSDTNEVSLGKLQRVNSGWSFVENI